MMGYHPHFEGENIDLRGAKALIITTSQETLGEGGKKTGVFGSEMTAPYYRFSENGMDVDIASIEGGEVPIDPKSFKWYAISKDDQRYLKDKEFQNKTKNSLKVADVDFSQYDIVFLAGGWGAAYDLGYSEILGEKISGAHAEQKPIGAVCHGPLGLLKAVKKDGSPLVKGLHVTAVTDKQVKELGITQTPQHPETELRKAGALFESRKAFRDILANHVVADGMIVTGQNQNAGSEVAYKLMLLLKEKQDCQKNKIK
jgi:putative intracellular protease/amidase